MCVLVEEHSLKSMDRLTIEKSKCTNVSFSRKIIFLLFKRVMGKMSTICNLDFVDYNFWCYILLSLHINHRRSIFVSKSTIDPHV